MTAVHIRQLQLIANELRQDVIRVLGEAQSGHTGGSLGTADIFAALYFHPILRHRAKQPHWPARDRFVLSNGHICPILYASLARAGFFPPRHLHTLRRINSILQGHPNRLDTPGVEVSTGPLGEGLSAAVGMAIAAKIQGEKHHVFCMVGDGEMQEGMIWEALMLAGHRQLPNFTMIVDRNYLQIDGKTEEINRLDPLDKKLRAFNFHTVHLDGHSMSDVVSTLEMAKRYKKGPVAIIARTIMGKGVSFMQDDAYWHGSPPKKDQIEPALLELQRVHKQLSV